MKLILSFFLALFFSAANAQYFPPLGNGSPTGACGGDTSGTYPNCTVAKINGATLSTTTATAGNLLVGQGANWLTKVLSGDCTLASSGAITCTKTGGVAFAASATTNTTLVANVVGAAPLASPTFTGAVTAPNLNVSGAITAPFGTAGVGLVGLSSTQTDATTAAGTITSVYFHNIGIPTLATTGNAITATNAYTLDIAGCPIGGAHVTIGTCGGLRVGGGNVQLNGALTASANATLFGTVNLNPSNGSAVTNINTGTSTGNATIGATGNTVQFPGPTNFTGTMTLPGGSTLGTTTATAGNLLVGQGSSWLAEVLSGDCTLASSGAITCTKTGGVAFAASATTDATNATNISTGTLAQARLPSLAGINGECYVIAQSASPSSAGADTTEDTLASISLPGGSIGVNGFLRIYTQFTITSSANAKTQKIYFGNGLSGTLYYNVPIATPTVVSVSTFIYIFNRGVANSQAGNPAAFTTGLGATTTAVTTSAVDTTATQSVTITGQKASSGENITLESYAVEVCPHS